ncbi:hypothetical protein [Tunicatimonas pelagia]|uniref:hypothetical protein n=1 Tax=Tunicatimonas pelagia TaxID=931531 RepID=UPI0026656DDE|nr:hypothetical protein [Tunicatimonas pelagia]WKN43389.1 hypothetical protein P0M28_00195 [Tunicatimonas pelagia]
MKKLELPYIGIKIESLPTILKVLDSVDSDEKFFAYYEKVGKSRRTAYEYLHSLRNMKLAKRGTDENTIITKAGKKLIEDEVERLYENLYSHSIRSFPDLKILKDSVQKDNVETLNELIESLKKQDYKIGRKQTLSSFLKILKEGNKKNFLNSRTYFSKKFKGEVIEYNQFKKIVKNYLNEKGKIKLSSIFEDIHDGYLISRDQFVDYLNIMQRNNLVKLYEINPNVVKDDKTVFKIRGRVYYYIKDRLETE